jgi:hypothetical protein
MPLATDGEKKETGMTPGVWFQIIDKHEIPVMRE